MWRRFAFASLLLAIVLAVVFLAAPGAQDERRIGAGVDAGGVDLSGLTLAQATAKLQAELGPRVGRALRLGAAGRHWVLTMEQAKLEFDAPRTAERALYADPSPVAPSDAGAPLGGVVPVALRHSRRAVRAFVADVARRVYRAPREASLTIELTGMHVRRSRLGHALDKAGTDRRIDAELADLVAGRHLHQRLVRVRPKVSTADLSRIYDTIVTVDRATFTLRLFERLRLSRSYPIGVGAAGFDTPAGLYRITDKQVNPAWHAPDKPWAGPLAGQTIAPGAPNNPLKSRWLGIADGVGIHGTATDWSIGTRASHGCIRMHVWDVEELYQRVPVGATVLIR